MPRLALIGDNASDLAGGRRIVEAEDLDRVTRLGILDLGPVEVVQRAHLSPGVSGDDCVPDPKCPALDEHGRHRPTAYVESRLDDRTGRLRVRIRLQALQ